MNPEKLLLTSILLLSLGFPAHGTETALTALSALGGRRVEALEAAPGGQSVLVLLRTRDASYAEDFVDSRHRILLHVDAAGGRTRRLATDCDDVRRPVWSPDGRRIAHFAKRNGVFGVAVRSFPGDTVERWIELTGDGSNPVGAVADIVWSGSGRSLAVVHDPQRSWRERFIRRTSVSVDELRSPIVIDSKTARSPLMSIQGFDGSLFSDSTKRLLVVDLEGGVRELPWTPGGDVALLRMTDEALVAKVEDRVVVIGFDDAEPRSSLADRVAHASSSFVLSTVGNDLVLYRFGAGPALQLDRVGALGSGRGMRPAGFTSSGDVLMLREEGMSTDLLLARSGSDVLRPLFAGQAVVRPAVSSGGRVVFFVVTTATTPEELWFWREQSGAALPLTGLSERHPVPARVERVSWSSPDGTPLEGLLVLPTGGSAPYRTLLFLHGGPEDRVRFDFHFLASLHQGGAALAAASRGWAVFLPNFRGSTGYGVEWRRALQNGRYLSMPAEDSLSGVDTLVDRGLAHPDALAIGGFSYGGTLAAWIIGRDHRFRAAVAMAGDLDLLHGDRSRLRGDRALHALGGDRSGPEDGLLDAWLAPEKYLALSPIESAVNIRTPLLLLSTAMEQLAETGEAAFFNGASLRDNPVRWIHYPTTWHGGSWSPQDRLDATSRVLEWIEQWTIPR